MLLRMFIFRRKSADEFVLRVDNLQRDIGGSRVEEIIDHGAGGRVLGGWLLGWKWCAYERIVINAKRWRGLVEPECIRFCRLRRLPQGRDVVESPEGAAVRCNDEIVAVNG